MATILNREVTVTLRAMECGECGSVFGISEAKYKRCKERGEDWYCPNGHCRVFTNTENKELKDRIGELERQGINMRSVIQTKNERIEQLKYSVRAQKAARTKIMNRMKNGVCPCCNRQFSDLQHHFRSKHPELMEKR